MSEYIITELKDRILRVQLNRPEKKNAITPDMNAAMADAIYQAEQNPEVRVILFHGSEDCFSAGADIKGFQSVASSSASIQSSRTEPPRILSDELIKAKKPLIAAVNGFAIGVGTTMLFHFDLVYAGENAKFRLPFVNLGLVPEFGSTFMLPRLAGHYRAAELFYFGDFFTAKEAYDIGFVNKIFPSDQLFEKVYELAKILAEKPPDSLRQIKALLKQHITETALKVALKEIMIFGQKLRSPEAAEAFEAFFERRKPDFSKFV